MYKKTGIIFSILFILETFLIMMPALGTPFNALTTPNEGQGIAYYIPQYNSVVFLYNTSGIEATQSNFTTLDNGFASYFNTTVQVKFPNGTSYTQSLPISSYSHNIYFVVNDSSNQIVYVIFLTDVIGKTSTQGIYVPTNYIYSALKIPSSLSIVNSTDIIQTQLYSIPIINEITTNYVKNDIVNPQNTKPDFFYEYVYGALTNAISVNKISISTTATNNVLVYAPFSFTTPGFINTLQQSGALGSALASESSYYPVIWGRALINTNIFDPYGADNLTFQLNYSTSGQLRIQMVQLGWVSSITNFPSTFSFLSYNFSNGYLGFLGFITDAGKISVAVNGYSENILPSGNISVDGKNYSVLLFSVSTKHAPTEYVNNLTVYYWSGNTFYMTQFSNNHGTNLPVYNIYASPGSTISVKGYYNGTLKMISINVGQKPNETIYTDYATLSATAYEGIIDNVSSFYVTSPILSTPPTTVLIHGITGFTVVGNLSASSASAVTTLFTNASLTFSSPLPGISFNGILVTPAYPLINGTSVMQYMGTMQYQNGGDEYGIAIIGSQIPMETINNSLVAVDILPPFSTTLVAPSIPASLTGSGVLEINYETNSQDSYITLVNMGLWSNETVVNVNAYSADGNVVTSNSGYFYGIVIPPSLNVTYEGYNESIVRLYDPGSILVPDNVSGSFTYAQSEMLYANKPVQGTLIFYGSTVYKTQGTFGTPLFNDSVIGSFGYAKEGLSYNTIHAYQLMLNGVTVTPYVNGTYSSLLQNYADNNPLVNIFFEQSKGYPTITPLYTAGLNITYLNYLLSSESQPGFVKLIPNGTYYYLYIYPTFKVLPYYAPLLSPYDINSIAVITGNSTFVHSTVYLTYTSTDYASYYYYPYILKTNVTVQNVTAKLYFQSNVTPLYAPYVNLYYYEPYYGTNQPSYLALGTYGTMIWHSPNYYEFDVQASILYLADMKSMTVKLQNGQIYSVNLTTKNVTSLFMSVIGEQIKPYSGLYMFEINIPTLEKILGMNAAELNNSILNVTVYDFVTHETVVASTELSALPGLTLISAQPTGIFYFMTFKSNNGLTGSTPWFPAYSVLQHSIIEFTDQEYANGESFNVLSLSITNITVEQGSYEASIVYHNGRTIVTDVYGNVVANYTGNLIPTIPETKAGSGIFESILPFIIIRNNTMTTINFNGITVYTNGTLGFVLSNGVVVPLAPAGLFALPSIPYNGQIIGYQGSIYVNVTDYITSTVIQTTLTSSNETPIRLSLVPTKPPMPNAPMQTYYYNTPVTISPENSTINIRVTSVIPYPYEFYVVAVVRQGINASASAPVVYYSYGSVSSAPYLSMNYTPRPYLTVAIPMSGLIQLQSGQPYTVEIYALPFPQGPVISDYPTQIVITDLTVIS